MAGCPFFDPAFERERFRATYYKNLQELSGKKNSFKGFITPSGKTEFPKGIYNCYKEIAIAYWKSKKPEGIPVSFQEFKKVERNSKFLSTFLLKIMT